MLARRRVEEVKGEHKAATLIQGKQRQKLAAKRVEARARLKREEREAKEREIREIAAGPVA